MKKSLLNIVFRMARDKLKAHPEREHFPHFTFLVKNSQIVCMGMNNSKIPHPKWGYQAALKDLGFQAKTHSELQALSKCRGQTSGLIAINVRLSRKGLPRMSMPCINCYKVLQTFGVKKCYFTTDFNWGEILL